MTGPAGEALLGHVLALIESEEGRVRALRSTDAASRALTVDVLLANLASAAFNRLDPDRYLAVGFRTETYAQSPLSYRSMVLARDVLAKHGLIEVHGGYRLDHELDFMRRSALSRLRATPALRNLFQIFDLAIGSLSKVAVDLIVVKKPASGLEPEPSEVEASRDILEGINARLANSAIELPEDCWERIRGRRLDKAAGAVKRLPSSGDQSAKALYRVFNRNWTNGGRLYGGWWEHVDGVERPHITIDGEPTIEIDFGTMHPAILYYAVGKPMDIEPYHLPPYSRELCKETFQRLLNRGARTGGADIQKAKTFRTPDGISFSTFMADYKRHLSGVAHTFGKNIGLILQREDSDLALAILNEMDKQGVAALPVHDSFIVKKRHRDQLEVAMRAIYFARYGVEAALNIPGE
jgi:hypothetical protein